MVKIHFAYFKQLYGTNFAYFWGYTVIGVGKSEFEVRFGMTPFFDIQKIEHRQFSAFPCHKKPVFTKRYVFLRILRREFVLQNHLPKSIISIGRLNRLRMNRAAFLSLKSKYLELAIEKSRTSTTDAVTELNFKVFPAKLIKV